MNVKILVPIKIISIGDKMYNISDLNWKLSTTFKCPICKINCDVLIYGNKIIFDPMFLSNSIKVECSRCKTRFKLDKNILYLDEKLTNDEKIRRTYLANGWTEEFTESGARIFTAKISEAVTKIHLSDETKKQLEA